MIIFIIIYLDTDKDEEEKWWRITEIIHGDELKERSACYHSYPTSELREDAEHLEDVKVATEDVVQDKSQHNPGSSAAAESVATSSPTSQTPPLQSSAQPSSQAASSTATPHDDRDMKQILHEGINNCRYLRIVVSWYNIQSISQVTVE